MDKISLLKGAKVLVEVCAGLRPSERVLIVADTENISIARTMAYAVKMIGAEYTIAVMEPRKTHGEDPTLAIANAMLGADVVFAPTKFSLSHSKAREEANKYGVRFISMPDYREDMLKGGAIEADFLEVQKTVNELAETLERGKRVQIMTPSGTNMVLNINDRLANKVSGVCREPGTWGSPPNIEVNISPIEDESKGIVVVDGSIPMPEIGVINEPFKIKVEKGRIVEINGGAQAEVFKGILEANNNPNCLVLGEFGIGLNPKARITGSMLEDEGAYGTIHFGWGHNYDSGGRNIAPTHIDTVIKNPMVIIDGKTIIENGELIK